MRGKLVDFLSFKTPLAKYSKNGLFCFSQRVHVMMIFARWSRLSFKCLQNHNITALALGILWQNTLFVDRSSQASILESIGKIKTNNLKRQKALDARLIQSC